MVTSKRRPWLDVDNKTLIALWPTVGSVALIAIIMKRSASSVQTQASRLGLPQRAEDKDKHRRRWVEGDDEKLDGIVAELQQWDGMIPIQDVAQKMERSVDAIVARLANRHGEDSDIMRKLIAPTPDVVQKNLDAAVQKETAQAKIGGRKTRKCLKCRRSFSSEGNWNWVCGPCKRNGDWDFD